MTLQSLIDKRDSFEIVRDKIAQLLADEFANQQALALVALRDANDFKVRIYAERASPFETFPDNTADFSPVCNIWFESLQFDESASNVMERQKTTGSYNLDVYGFGRSQERVSGFASGDKTAAFEAQRGARLVRNILMSAENTYLGLRGLVGRRRFQNITSFQPQIDGRNIYHVVGVRLNLMVDFNEFSPQYTPVELESLTAQINRAETGEVIASVSFDYT